MYLKNMNYVLFLLNISNVKEKPIHVKCCRRSIEKILLSILSKSRLICTRIFKLLVLIILVLIVDIIYKSNHIKWYRGI